MPSFIPAITTEGGTAVGCTYLATWAQCPYKWALRYWYPHRAEDTGDTIYLGIAPRWTSSFLIAGRVFHEGLAAWYASGVKGGQDTGARDLDQAIAVADMTHKKALREYESQDQAAEDWATCEVMLRSYHDRYGPTAANPEFPEVQVAVDGNGEPLVERTFTIPLGYGDYIFTSKPDLLMYKNGYLMTRDHKTSHFRFVRERLSQIDMDHTITGENLVLAELFPDEPLHGSELNVTVKQRANKSKFDVAEREVTHRTPSDLEAFKLEVVDILKQIDEATYHAQANLNGGDDLEDVMNDKFPRHGSRTGACYAFRGCEFRELCTHKDRLQERMRHFHPRRLAEVVEERERPY